MKKGKRGNAKNGSVSIQASRKKMAKNIV